MIKPPYIFNILVKKHALLEREERAFLSIRYSSLSSPNQKHSVAGIGTCSIRLPGFIGPVPPPLSIRA